MPLSGPHTYIETIDEFLGHWPLVNADLAAPLTPNGYAIADLGTDKTTLEASITSLNSVMNDLGAKRMLRDGTHEPDIRNNIFQLKFALKGSQASTGYHGAPLTVPGVTEDRGNWYDKMDKAVDAWTKVNALATPDLTLGTLTLAAFTAKVAAMNTLLSEIESLESVQRDRVREREDIMDRITDHLQDYISAVQGQFAPDHPHVLSLPRLWALPGRTPDPTTLSGSYNVVTNKFDLTWLPSEDEDLASYKIYGGLADAMSTGTPNSFLATIPAGTHSFSTTYGTTSGAGFGATFKVYVVLDTGNVAGSNALTLHVPPPAIPG